MRWTALPIICAAGFSSGPGFAQEAAAPVATLELNKLEAKGDACNAFMVARNQLSKPLESLNLDLVIFDPDDVITRRVAVEMGPLRTGKTVVKAFALAGLPCDGVGKILLNDVLVCRGEVAPVADCLDRVETSSRQPQPFLK